MATHSSIIAWEIPWTEESGGLSSMGSLSRTQLNGQGVVALKGAFSERLTHTHTHTHFVESVPGLRAPDMPWGRSEVEVGLTRCPEGLSWFLRD